jgi:L-amino acid N-acyltransferase YncA
MAIIRRAMEKDIPRILELYRQLSFEPEKYKAPPVNDCLKIFRKMSQYPGYELLVAEDNGQVVGTTVLAVIPGIAIRCSGIRGC